MKTAEEIYYYYTGKNLTVEQLTKRAMVEFAKFHCKAQLEAILSKAKTKNIDGGWQGGGTSITVIDKESIKNAYNLDNIK
tara:strand:- start:126 stop:365 length:240 start_codon:yes stop_codon:yes gene_type:complete